MSNDPNDNSTNLNVVDEDRNHDISSSSNNNSSNSKDDHEHDMVMPGFRFHPTEEELVEFYLRRKVEGKRFNVELITFLDLYRYDPWELPALAAIGEKEWFFYVPRDRKYRNGDRPNRVTTSGYWKATGADRMIRGENSRSIGLKKTLVFYSGKAPKGIRTSWIMNEYRLPHHETERYQKAEISLCRVYKRAGVEDHPSLPRCLLTRRPSDSSRTEKRYPQEAAAQQAMERFQAFGGGQTQQMEMEKIGETEGSSSTSTSDHVTTALGLSKQNVYRPMAPPPPPPPISTTLGLPSGMEGCCSLLPNPTTLFPLVPSSVSPNVVVDDLHRLVTFQQPTLNQQQYYTTNQPHPHLHLNHHQQQQQQQPELSALPPQSQAQQLSLNVLPAALSNPTAFDRLWEWNPTIPEGNREYNINNNPFK
ncbi:NAC domain containing protein 35, Arabidopsis NAC domain containing protein 34 [Hibiscus trionum]|uniref:NAC domain containing protein 35, Arabidopsis NAC domain containing protein 34 n=1 Tax=Hibiscus trionum TaxID=183268 RepID=A0A9W7LUW9_HIBTR|nr:NAC domain containing protein 35, Arabidopsis NAC domain containing protein 34 [Hibiscus trionum]